MSRSKLGDDARSIMAKLDDARGDLAALAGAADQDQLVTAAEDVLEELLVGRAPAPGLIARLKAAVALARGGT